MKIYKVFQTLDVIYIFLLSIGVGCIICAGFSAATIFQAANFVPDFTMSDSGLIMGLIFIKCNDLFNFLAVVIIIYEILSSLYARHFTHTKQRQFLLLLGGINVIISKVSLCLRFSLLHLVFLRCGEASSALTHDTQMHSLDIRITLSKDS